MRMRKLTITLTLTALGLLPAFSQSQTQQDLYNPIATAVTSRTIAPDGVGASMGDIGAATAPDVYSQYWNPAKYPFTISRAGLGINYTPWLKSIVDGIALLNATGYVRLGDYQAVSASLDYFRIGEVSVDGNESMTVKPYEMSFDVAYSRMLSELLRRSRLALYIFRHEWPRL